MALFRKKREKTAPPAEAESPAAENGLMGRLKRGLSKTRRILTTDIDELFTAGKALDDIMEEIEERLITADVGAQTTMTLVDRLRDRAGGIRDAETLKTVLREEIVSLMTDGMPSVPPISAQPHVVMVVGVNGVGKTTTIGKLAARWGREGHKVLIGAADTFRAAAVEQLEIWAGRAGADFVRHRQGADPAAVAFDAVKAAEARGVDRVLVDTAGRLHTQVNLMEELRKIRRVMGKSNPMAPHEILLVVDATTGQNAISQAKLFHEALGVSDIALTKLDGTARGGVVVGICVSSKIPIRYLGIGEKIEDLEDFDPDAFATALLGYRS